MNSSYITISFDNNDSSSNGICGTGYHPNINVRDTYSIRNKMIAYASIVDIDNLHFSERKSKCTHENVPNITTYFNDLR